ncbi:hypothetical protein [Streptomyces coeruleorubidus]|uniref:hypothetical protein n=1 Tax=Streptomyces coeruleorubidus TaxID=116188 RepID=UPI003651F09B
MTPRSRSSTGCGPAGAEETAARSLYREHRDHLGELLAPWDLRPYPRGRADHAAQDVLASLAHMTVNRLLPVDLSREERIHGVWKNVLRTEEADRHDHR